MDATTRGSTPDTRCARGTEDEGAWPLTGARAVPVEVLLEEARRAADVLERHALPSPPTDEHPAHAGLTSADPYLTADLAEEIRALCTLVEGSTRRALPPFSPGIVTDGRRCLGEATAILRARARRCRALDAALEAHRRMHVRPRAATTVRDALTSLLAIFRAHPDVDATLHSKVEAKRDALDRELSARSTLRELHAKSPSERMLAMGRIATLLARLRAAARVVFAGHPSLRRQVTSEYQRRVKRERRAQGLL
ncbi:MAG: hypothetical protein U0183_16405 [Polyangiaceae bacterium]